MSTLDPGWERDREDEHDAFLTDCELDHAERMREIPEFGEPFTGDPLLHWPERDRALARERAAVLRTVSEPVCMERVRPARAPEGGLDAARGITLGLIGGLAAWVVIVVVAHLFGVGL